MDGNVYKAGFIQQKIQYVEFRYAWCHALDSLQLPLGSFRTASPLPLDAAGEGTGPSLFDSSGAPPGLPNFSRFLPIL